MTRYGGMRFDYDKSFGFTPGENRTLHIRTVDGDDADITSFVGWTFSFYLLSELSDGDGIASLDANALLKLTASGQTAPYIDFTLGTASLPAGTPKVYGYEVWRTDNVTRLAYGDFAIIR